jgi:hypothetical protein
MIRLAALALLLAACGPQVVRERSFQDGDQWCTERVTRDVAGNERGLLACEPLDGELEVR